MSRTVVIVGASHAAAELIVSLRKAGWTEKIVLIGDEPELPYQRPPLSKAFFKDQVSKEKLSIKGEQTYQKAQVDVVLGNPVTSVDRKNKIVIVENYGDIAYDFLVLATGTRARPLPIDGADHQRIHYLRTLRDVEQIKSMTSSSSRILIVGGGYIGLEVAASAISLGCEVTILEAQERVLARVTGDEVSNFYQRLHSKAGVEIRLSSALVGFKHEDEKSFALLEGGSQIPFDVAVIGIGVLPNIELAMEAGLECENGILVDEFTQTSDPSVYAIGDCSNHPSKLYQRRVRLESVQNAVDQAKTTAKSICGDPEIYDQAPWFWSDQYDVKLQTVGLLTGYDQSVTRVYEHDKKFCVFYLLEGRLIAMDAINSPADFMVARKLVAAGIQADVEALANSGVKLKEFL